MCTALKLALLMTSASRHYRLNCTSLMWDTSARPPLPRSLSPALARQRAVRLEHVDVDKLLERITDTIFEKDAGVYLGTRTAHDIRPMSGRQAPPLPLPRCHERQLPLGGYPDTRTYVNINPRQRILMHDRIQMHSSGARVVNDIRKPTSWAGKNRQSDDKVSFTRPGKDAPRYGAQRLHHERWPMSTRASCWLVVAATVSPNRVRRVGRGLQGGHTR